MNIGVLGASGSGKSRFCSVYGTSLSNIYRIPLYSTNAIKGSTKILYYDDILNLKNCVFIWDEVDNDLQGRNFKKNIEEKDRLLQWFKQCRKNNVIFLWNTQKARQLDIIGRENTHLIIYAENCGSYTKYRFYNNETGIWGITLKLDLSKFNNLYDHKEYLNELTWRERPKVFHNKTTNKPQIDKNRFLKFENPEVLSEI